VNTPRRELTLRARWHDGDEKLESPGTGGEPGLSGSFGGTSGAGGMITPPPTRYGLCCGIQLIRKEMPSAGSRASRQRRLTAVWGACRPGSHNSQSSCSVHRLTARSYGGPQHKPSGRGPPAGTAAPRSAARAVERGRTGAAHLSAVTLHHPQSPGADGGSRTLTALRPQDFKSCVSTIPPRPLSAILKGFRRQQTANCHRIATGPGQAFPGGRLAPRCPACGRLFADR
jgi:hypothetical protein